MLQIEVTFMTAMKMCKSWFMIIWAEVKGQLMKMVFCRKRVHLNKWTDRGCLLLRCC